MKNVLRNFVHHLDAMNTISGGTVATSVKKQKTDSHIQIEISAPTVSSDAFNIFVQGNHLIVYSTLKSEDQPWSFDEEEISSRHMVPLFHRVFDIPQNVAADQIEAVFGEGKLNLTLPFSEPSSTPVKRIHIREY